MKKTLFFPVLLLTGCYIANGSPSSVNFWTKNNKKISVQEIWYCERKSHANISERALFLYNKFRSGEGLSDSERKERFSYIDQAIPTVRQCYYDLGYRFNAPIYWCLAQDGDNSKVCVENMKYRK